MEAIMGLVFQVFICSISTYISARRYDRYSGWFIFQHITEMCRGETVISLSKKREWHDDVAMQITANSRRSESNGLVCGTGGEAGEEG